MGTDDEEWRFSVGPSEQPHQSSAYDGYLWKVEVEEGLYYITDIDEIAEYESEVKDRTVTILGIQDEARAPSTKQWLRASDE